MGQDRARAAAVADVPGEAAVLLEVGARGPDVDPQRPPLVPAVPMPEAFLDRVVAELGRHEAPGRALRLEAGGGVVLVRRGLGALAVFWRLREHGGIVRRRVLGPRGRT